MEVSASGIESPSRIDLPQQIYSCSVCEMKFLHESRKKLHEFASHDVQHERFPCPTCGQLFFLEIDLMAHYRFHNVDIAGIQRTSQDPTEAAQEVANSPPKPRKKTAKRATDKPDKGKTQQKKHECLQCGKRFAYESSLRMHIRGHDRDETGKNLVHRCYLCDSDTRFESPKLLLEHLKANHPTKPKYECNQCNHIAYRQFTFNAHMARHDSVRRPYKCAICPLRFQNRSYVRYHEDTAHKSDMAAKEAEPANEIKSEDLLIPPEASDAEDADISEPPLEENGKKLVPRCYLCDSDTRFESTKLLLDHLKTNHPTKDKYECNRCKHTTNSKYAFNTHISRHDSIRGLYKCGICPLRFHSRSNVRRHEDTAHNPGRVAKKKIAISERIENKNGPSCAKCGKTFMKHWSLKRHESEKACEVALQKCYLCPGAPVMDNKEALSQHLVDAHGDQNRFECTVKMCHRVSATAFHYNAHMVRHDPAVKPLKCRVCPLRFKINRTKEYHETSVHGLKTKTKIYYCGDCDKTFMLKHSLVRHERSTGHRRKPDEAAKSLKIRSASPRKPLRRRPKVVDDQNADEDPDRRVTRSSKIKFVCYLCVPSSSLGSREELAQHLESAHPQREVYQCKQCAFSVNTMPIFNQHLAQHDDGEAARWSSGRAEGKSVVAVSISH